MDVLKKHLKSENQIPELESLKILLGYQKTKGIKGIISDINKLIESKDEPSSRKLETIYARIVEHEPILEDFPDYSNQILDFKKNCFSRLIHAYLNQEQWEKCLHHITSFDKFYKHPELLNNAGICCVRLVLDGEINLYNYRELISIWLTTIYTDKVILKSLDTTSWDDEYTFTIYDSIGKFSKYIFKTEVENVNKDQPSENNISIGDTQRELRKLFESGLIRSKEQDFVDADTGDLVSVIEIMESFYSSEKESIEGLIDNLPYDITICTSEFAMKYHLAQTAVDQFDKRYQKENDERFLEAGARFAELIKNKDGDLSDGKNDVEKYKLSEHILNQIINSLKSQSLEGYDSAKVNINRFDTIKAKLESEATPVIHKLISENPVNYDLIEVLYRMLSILPFSENLKYIYAEYATNYCIHGINSKSMSEIAALELLMEIIKVTPNNHRTAKSLAALISMYLTNEDFLNKVVEMIPELSELNSESLYNSFISELSGIKEELNSWKRKTNDSYIKIQDIIKVIDELQTITEPVY
ncbi:MAG: hypothetical protein IIA45_08750 [Bacteroidetes bacterium]|nr:hypothetical protein [Bacteroidota bacterium]